MCRLICFQSRDWYEGAKKEEKEKYQHPISISLIVANMCTRADKWNTKLYTYIDINAHKYKQPTRQTNNQTYKVYYIQT